MPGSRFPRESFGLRANQLRNPRSPEFDRLQRSIPNFLVIEFHAHDVPWWNDLVDGEPPIRDGYILLGDAPGHGMTLNEDVARAKLRPGTSFLGMGRRKS